MKMFYEKDADVNLIKDKKIAIFFPFISSTSASFS